MKLTKREKVLLLSALIVITAAVFIMYIYLPLTKEINDLQIKSEDLTFQLQDAKTKNRLIIDLEKQITEAKAVMKDKQEDILKIWDQAELLVFVENILNGLCDKESIDFYDAVELDNIKAGDVGVKFKTDYNQLKNILANFEEAKYYNTITSLAIDEVEENATEEMVNQFGDVNSEFDNTGEVVAGETISVTNMKNLHKDKEKQLHVTLSLRFYAQNRMEQYPDDYDFMDKEFGKANIFQ
ncbi:MAG: hypothetical protein K0S76_672 [Herbinix sp.]|jgi:cell division protein FtsL|nr:hypothetical protein [Herbinix sp.]